VLPLTSREKTLVFIGRAVAFVSWRKIPITLNDPSISEIAAYNSKLAGFAASEGSIPNEHDSESRLTRGHHGLR
jgi:hypothetical protein